MKNEEQYYAVAQLDGPVFGFGKTHEEAKVDAVKQSNAFISVTALEDLLVNAEVAVGGDIFIAPATEEFIRHVENVGGDVEYDSNADGQMIIAD